MKVLLLAVVAAVCALPLYAGTTGEFKGTVVDGPEHSGAWIYVLGRNHSIRRVDVTRARIRYDREAPESLRREPLPKTLPAGTLVRITAEQDNAGEWRATEIEILGAEPAPQKKAPPAPTSQS